MLITLKCLPIKLVEPLQTAFALRFSSFRGRTLWGRSDRLSCNVMMKHIWESVEKVNIKVSTDRYLFIEEHFSDYQENNSIIYKIQREVDAGRMTRLNWCDAESGKWGGEQMLEFYIKMPIHDSSWTKSAIFFIMALILLHLE